MYAIASSSAYKIYKRPHPFHHALMLQNRPVAFETRTFGLVAPKKRARLWWRQPSPPKGMVTRPRAARHKTGLRTGANAPAFCAIVLKGTTDWASHSVWARPHCHCLSITVKCKPWFFSEGSVIVNNRCKHPIYTYILPNKSKQLLQLLLS